MMKRLMAFLLSCLIAGSMSLSTFAESGLTTQTPTQTEQTEGTQQGAETEKTEADNGAGKLDISQGTVPFIDESDPLMQNLAVYMVELTTNTLIHARNADVQRSPASLTKIMTAILTLENIPDLSRELTFTAKLCLRNQYHVRRRNLHRRHHPERNAHRRTAAVCHHAPLCKRGGGHAGV